MKNNSIRIAFFFLIFSSFNFNTYSQYYDGTSGLSGVELKTKLHQIIKAHKTYTYSEVKGLLGDIDEDPNNSDNVLLIYSRRSLNKNSFASNNEQDFWNREHVWAKSHGFPNEADTAYRDVHHLRPCDASVNTSRSNKDFNNVEHIAANEQGEAANTYTNSDFWEPSDEVKGDVARMMFYMDTRYNSDFFDLRLVDRESISGDPELGVLYTLIKWHELDPVDLDEKNRNEKIFGYQQNRNPFIDHPEWVANIWGSTTNPFMTLNTLSFSSDFGKVAAGSNLSQVYKLNTYNLTGDITISVDAPFSLSIDNTNWNTSITIQLSSINSAQQFNDIYVKFEPTSTGNFSSSIKHSTLGSGDISFDVKGEEGTQTVLSIADARTKALGEAVLVSGVVIDAGNNSGNSRVIYDGTAGVVVRSFDVGNESSNLVQGDSITVSGVLGDYRNILQISESPIVINLIKQNATLPEPQDVSISDINDDYESELVRIKGVKFTSGSTFQGGGGAGNFTVTDGSNTIICRIGSSNHPLVGTNVPDGIVEIVGFVGQFDNDYQISPRTSDDIIAGVTTSILSSEAKLLIYPNPVNNELFINLDNFIATKYSVSIANATGQIIYDNNELDNEIIDVRFLNRGIYYLRVYQGDMVIFKKFMKQ